MTKDAVLAYYAAFGEREWQRLTNPDDGAVEFALTKQFLARYLPPSGRILDLGGGPGRYTIWLAEHDYQVVLADLSPELLAMARTQIAAAGVGQQVGHACPTLDTGGANYATAYHGDHARR